MSEQRQMLADTVDRLFRDAAAQRDWKTGAFDAALWSQVEDLGLPGLLVPEAQGGVGGNWEDAFVVLRAAGHHALPLPLGEAMLAARLAASAGLELPAGLATLAEDVQGELSGTAASPHFSGSLRGVPWGRDARTLVTRLAMSGRRTQIVALQRETANALDQAENLASEPRDTLGFSKASAAAARSEDREADALPDYLALIRCGQIVGALEAALQLSVNYAQERRQFGRAIGQFQAVQQQLALFGAEVAAVNCAARAAFRAAAKGEAGFEIAAAKLRANLAIGLVTSTAHQVHAAIGFTQEYALRRYTQRLWSWRTEGGNDRAWSERLGAQVCARGAENFWSDLTARDDAVGLVTGE